MVVPSLIKFSPSCFSTETSAVCLDFDCITEEEDDDSVCSCQSATFNNQDCGYCEFDEDSGSTPTVDCSNVGGPNQAAFDMCLFEVEEEEQEENIDSVEEITPGPTRHLRNDTVGAAFLMVLCRVNPDKRKS